MFLRAPYNYDADEASNEAGLLCKDPSKAQQNQKEEADINNIVKRFNLTGQLPDNVRAPQYGDFTAVTDYQSALNAVMEADAAFMLMPAEIRRRFNNNPELFVEFCSDPNNSEELVRMGLAVKNEVAPEGARRATEEPASPPSGGTNPAPATGA